MTARLTCSPRSGSPWSTPGRTTSGLTALNKAASQSAGPAAGRVLERRGIALWTLGQHRLALEDLRRAVPILHGAGDTIWEARALTARGMVHLAMNATARASADFAAAAVLFAATSQELERAYALHNLGLAAFRSGDLPAALSHLDQAARQYRRIAVPVPDLSLDRCAVLLAAGLPGDALIDADTAVRDLERSRGQATKVARAAADRRPGPRWPAPTRRQRCCGPGPPAACSRLSGGHGGTRTPPSRCCRPAMRPARYPWACCIGPSGRHRAWRHSAPAMRRGRSCWPGASRWRSAARRTRSGTWRPRRAAGCAGGRVGAGRRVAGRRAARGGGQLPAHARRCRRGFDVVDQHMLTLGATELRARATMQGAEFAALAQRHALPGGEPRMLLQWSERGRATALAVPPVRPVDDRELQADLTAVRDVACRLDLARARGQPTARLAREQLRLEAAIRARAMRTRGRGRQGNWDYQGNWDFSITQLLSELGPARLVQIVEIDGDLHLLVCGGGRVRHFAAGRLEDAAREIDYARFWLPPASALPSGQPAGEGARRPGAGRAGSRTCCWAGRPGISATARSSSSRPAVRRPMGAAPVAA